MEKESEKIAFYVGPNGCGKTRFLINRAKTGIAARQRALAIANTPFVRFPRSRELFKVFRVSPQGINRVVEKNLNRIFGLEEFRDSSQLSELLYLLGFFQSVKLSFVIEKKSDFILDNIIRDEQHLSIIYSILENSRFQRRIELDVSDSSDSFRRSLSEESRVFLLYIQILKEAGIVKKYSLVFHHRDRKPQPFNMLSSGEQTLISTYLFIKANIYGLETIYIDEPENSLHPEWQRRYIEMLYMAIGYRKIRILLATHSPVLVSGAVSSYREGVEVFKIDKDVRRKIEIDYTTGDDSVEEILWEAFDTLTPVNHFLSIELSGILHKLTNGEINKSFAKEQIQEFVDKSYNKKQIGVLKSVLERLPEFDRYG